MQICRSGQRLLSVAGPAGRRALAPHVHGLKSRAARLLQQQFVERTAHTQAKRGFLQVRAMTAATQEAEVKEKPQPIFRKDYQPPPYLIEQVNLDFNLGEESTRVRSELTVVPNYGDAAERPDLFLDGRNDVKLVSVAINGQEWPAEHYVLSEKSLTLKALPAGKFKLEVQTDIKPQENTLLEGLYKSSGNFCTQCEAQGFRGITYFLDRPDVMAKYTTRIEADKAKYPVLLGNGNLVDSGELEGGRHFTVWEDPWKKPCYLFALVAGDLAMHEDSFTTASGRSVTLRIFVGEQNISKVGYAMESLKRAMKWDEDRFGLEYDLDLFNIVAVDDFNMGAMENKSLNVFNSRLVLASPETATDTDYYLIEGVVGHEYFHNWTGNRVTCRDWFQLTLKEGLTVYRDAEFTSDMNSRPVKRISGASRLRTAQFSQDASPLAHPIRPDSYIKMDNFYTVTVYEKGAEVILMYETLLGRDGFRKGMDLYFERHDGQAVTCDDFLAAMADANGADLSVLARWYSQAGTPELTVSTEYDKAAKTFTVRTKQYTPPTAGQDTKLPVLIPLSTGLVGPDGKDMPLKLRGSSDGPGSTTAVLRCDAETNEFVFEGVEVRPVPSLLRNFSAPVKMTVEGQSEADLEFLLQHDSDAFNRWESGQRLAMKLLVGLYHEANASGQEVPEAIAAAGGVPASFVQGFRNLLAGDDPAFIAMALSLPSQTELLDAIGEADPVLAFQVRREVSRLLAQELQPELRAAVKANDAEPGEAYSPDAASCARRALKSTALSYLSMLGTEEMREELLQRFRDATNMTDQLGALGALVHTASAQRDTALAEFYERWQGEPLVMLKWLGMQSGCSMPANLDSVRALEEHPAFNVNNPNNCYSLYLGFAQSTPNFHAADGSGYAFLADAVLKVDKINHQVAARMVTALSSFRKVDKMRQALVIEELQRIVGMEGISENVFELASKSLD